jgi:hypothetical protein
MRVLAFVFLVLSFPAIAADEPQFASLPTSVIGAVMKYLVQRPYAEVAPMVGAMQQCLSRQLPNQQGAITPFGECPGLDRGLSK